VSGPDSNKRVFDSVANTYTDLALKPAERRALALLGHRLHEMDMLDLGVGAGRTGYTFAPLVRRYVGLDYSPRMLERARDLLGKDEQVELVLGDASDLSVAEGEFDFVLFSFNGIDAVGHEGRLKILGEVRGALRPDGYFLFSSHSTGALPLDTKQERSPRFRGSRLYELYARLTDISYGRRIRRINRSLDLKVASERGWIIVPGRGHDFQIDDYYIDPKHQVEQLREVGFDVEAIYDLAGRDVALPFRGRDPWLDYLCRVRG
jgi:ubiquinone/menaquinone biosynthesis C-methylase UbiE